MKPFALLLLASLLAPGPTAWAQEGATPAPPPQTETVWYGWQTLIADAATGVATAFVASTRDGTASAVTFGVGFTFVPAIIHGVHGRPLVSLGDFLLRGGAETAAGALFVLSSCGGGSDPDTHATCDNSGSVAAGVAILAATSILDAAAFSWETRPVLPDKQPAGQAFALAPSFAFDKDRAVVGVAGRF